MRRVTATLALALALMPCAAATAAPVAPAPPVAHVLAASSGSGQAAQAGDKLGKLITGWGKAILLAVAGFMAIGALIERHVGKALTIFMLALLAGSFLYAPDNMGHFVTNVANQLFG